MNREEKTQLLSELNELFSNAEIVVVSHYKGLTVQEVSELRNNIRKAGAGFRVTKNRITRLALKGTKFEAFQICSKVRRLSPSPMIRSQLVKLVSNSLRIMKS